VTEEEEEEEEEEQEEQEADFRLGMSLCALDRSNAIAAEHFSVLVGRRAIAGQKHGFENE